MNLNWNRHIHLTGYLKGRLEGLSASYASSRETHDVIIRLGIKKKAFSQSMLLLANVKERLLCTYKCDGV
jgi:hypothetical protein